MKKISVALLSLALPALVLGQANTAGKSTNLIYNGSFESFWQADNLWDGVDTNGFLAGTRGTAKAVTERGTVDNVAMALSVQAADMNGDGLVDLVTIDADDIIRIYFNSGTAAAPKFTHGEIVPVFLAQLPHVDSSIRKAYRIGVADLAGNGVNDILLGNYGGELMILKNSGSRTNPDFRQPTSIESIVVPTNKAGSLWGNLFAPAAADFSKTGRIDFLIGDGGYSANNIHLFINQGNGPAPKLSDENRQYLAYGDGREQLIPAVVDYNGDGNLDLIVGDRKGALNLYLSKGPWNKDKELEFSSVLTLGKTAKFNGCVAPAVADFSGNGLFDIVIGKTNGRIALSVNKGTKEQPKFEDPVELKGVDVWNRTTTRNPSDWSIDFGKSRGNLLGYFTVVKEEEDADVAPLPNPDNDPKQKHALKAGYFQSLNKVVRFQYPIFPGSNSPDIVKAHGKPNEITPHIGRTAQESAANADSNVLTIRKIIDGSKLKPNANYAFSFKVKGRSVSKATWHYLYNGVGERSEAKIVSRGARGRVTKKVDEAKEQIIEEQSFGVSGSWTTVSRTINTRFIKERDLNDPAKFAKPPRYTGVIEIRLHLRPGEGVCYLDDMQLVPL